ncbi:hypothetical protein C1646_757421 [Rhizophagus diaphanus]|nr:hypothetical protein C1646_757421 [Rhizophagus diaphanus] [Rhizophagus sp. MUCL 43196]
MALGSTVIEGYQTHVVKGIAAMCKIWVTDEYGNYVTGNNNYHKCDSGSLTIDTLSNDTYWLVVRVEGSLRKNKHRGPFNQDTCYYVYGAVDNWHLNTDEYCE